DIEDIVATTLRGALYLERYPFSHVSVSLDVRQAAGSVQTVCINAALAACMVAGIDVTRPVVGVSVGVVQRDGSTSAPGDLRDSVVLHDLCYDEQGSSTRWISGGFTPPTEASDKVDAAEAKVIGLTMGSCAMPANVLVDLLGAA
ncbi:hypothetical protein KIPB_014462, partial [Kipferlia bialata]